MKKIGLQLYSIREVMPKDEAGVREIFRRLSEAGYDQIEPAGLPIDPALFAAAAKDAGLEIVSTHYNANEIFDNPEQALRVHEILGCRNIGVGGWGPLETPEHVEALIEKANRAAKVFAPEGYRFIYHNHSHEFIVMDNGRKAYDMLLEGLDPNGTALELDCFWAQNAGLDPAAYLRAHGDRIRLVHLKDMGVRRNPETNRAENFITEVGHGNMNYKGIVAAADEVGIEAFVVEQDANWMDGDPMKAVASSCRYIRENLMN